MLNLIKKKWGRGGGGSGGGLGTETKTVCQTVSNEVNTKIQLSTQCRACGTIKTFLNTLIRTNPTTFILSFLVSEFLPKNLNLNSVCQKQNVKCGKIQKSNHLHTVEHVVQSTFQNMLITFYAQTLLLLF